MLKHISKWKLIHIPLANIITHPSSFILPIQHHSKWVRRGNYTSAHGQESGKRNIANSDTTYIVPLVEVVLREEPVRRAIVVSERIKFII